jgi:uncharacterized protein YjeT (DUF2065 family)
MNIDDLKSAWNSQPGIPVSEQRWKEMLQQESKNPLSKLKRRTAFEWIMGVVISISMIIFWIVMGMPAAAVVYMLLGIYSFFYSRHQMQLVRKIESVDGDVKHNLEQHVNALERFFQRNALYTALLTPCLLAFLGWTMYTKTGEMPIKDFPSTYPEAVLPYGGFLLFMGLLFYLMVRATMKFKYGRHLKQLRRKAAQLQEEI